MQKQNSSYLSYNELRLPEPYQEDLLPVIKKEFESSAKTVVVLDDDPTGTQTCYNVPVLMRWDLPLLTQELNKKPPILFVLTNSRSLPEAEAFQLTAEVGKNLKEASLKSGRDIIAISRSDSTLRGHFPSEVNAIASSLGCEGAIILLVPAFIEGKRFTIEDVHYIVENNQLIPVADTPFAKDAAFGYSHSNLKKWVEEKSQGAVKAEEVRSISLEELRTGGPDKVCRKLKGLVPGTVCVVNAADTKDIEVLTLASINAEKCGKSFIFRTSATLVPIRAGMPSGKLVSKKVIKKREGKGSLIVVGSYVPKTTEQLNYLIGEGRHEVIEVNVKDVLDEAKEKEYLKRVISQIDELLGNEKDVIVYTSRNLITGNTQEESLRINSRISSFMVRLINGIGTRPSFIISKGGITSNDVASNGLAAKKALVLGQVLPGVPVWQMALESKFPGIIYVVFPGNVGGKEALSEAFKALKYN